MASHPRAAQVHRRTQGRLNVRLHAKLIALTTTYGAILEDISRSGAHLSIDNAPPRDTNVVLRWETHEAFGTVFWSSPRGCGLRFSKPLGEEVLRATLALDEAMHLPDDSNLASEAAREWAEGKTGRFD